MSVGVSRGHLRVPPDACRAAWGATSGAGRGEFAIATALCPGGKDLKRELRLLASAGARLSRPVGGPHIVPSIRTARIDRREPGERGTGIGCADGDCSQTGCHGATGPGSAGKTARYRRLNVTEATGTGGPSTPPRIRDRRRLDSGRLRRSTRDPAPSRSGVRIDRGNIEIHTKHVATFRPSPDPLFPACRR